MRRGSGNVRADLSTPLVRRDRVELCWGTASLLLAESFSSLAWNAPSTLCASAGNSLFFSAMLRWAHSVARSRQSKASISATSRSPNATDAVLSSTLGVGLRIVVPVRSDDGRAGRWLFPFGLFV